MTERHYTLREIDEMRALVGRIMDAPTWAYIRRYGAGLFNYSFATPAKIEDRLRTYMMAGVGPEELRAELERVSRPPPEGVASPAPPPSP